MGCWFLHETSQNDTVGDSQKNDTAYPQGMAFLIWMNQWVNQWMELSIPLIFQVANPFESTLDRWFRSLLICNMYTNLNA